MFDSAKVATLIREYFGTAFIEVIRREIVFLNLIEPQKVDTNEKDLQWKINYAGNSSVGSYSENDSLGTAGEQAYTTASLDWALNKGKIRVSGLAQRISEGTNSIINALTQESESVLKDLKRNINLQLLSDGVGNLNGVRPELDATGKDITGIQAAIDDGSAVTTYAGVDRSTNMWWRSYVLDNGGTLRSLTEALMFQIYNEIATREGQVTHILCSPNTWTTYGLMLEQERRQVNPGYTLSGGFKAIDFNGIPIVMVPGYQENRMDFLDMSQLTYRMLLDFAVEPRDPGNYDATTFIVKHYTQLEYKNPWLSGSLRDIKTF